MEREQRQRLAEKQRETHRDGGGKLNYRFLLLLYRRISGCAPSYPRYSTGYLEFRKKILIALPNRFTCFMCVCACVLVRGSVLAGVCFGVSFGLCVSVCGCVRVFFRAFACVCP